MSKPSSLARTWHQMYNEDHYCHITIRIISEGEKQVGIQHVQSVVSNQTNKQ